MSKLISGKEALIALANGVNPSDIEGKFSAGLDSYLFISIEGKIDLCVKHLNEELFRLKPRTITINGIKVPAPFEPKDGDKYYHISIQTSLGYGWDEWESSDYDARASIFGAWRTEEEIKQVVEALRSVFKPQ